MSYEPDKLLSAPERTVTCFQSVQGLDEALEREAVIRFQRGEAIPCLELRSVKVADMKEPRIRDLRQRCRQLGVDFENRGTKVENSLEVRRRSGRNRHHTKAVRQ